VTGVKLNNKLLTACLILCIATLTITGTAKGQTIVPGLIAGNYFDYHVTSYWTSSDSYASIPENLREINQTSHFEVRISFVNETNIDTFSAYYYANGSALSGRGNVNLLTGTSYGDFVAIIGANLNAGDKIHPDGTDGITIKETVTRNYESGSRPTNHVSITDTNETAGYTASRDLYFDQATGILVEQVDRTDTNNPSSTTIVTSKINSGSIWVIPEFPAMIAIPIFMIAAAFSAIAYKKKFIKVPVKP
jgi:hypothetical protein